MSPYSSPLTIFYHIHIRTSSASIRCSSFTEDSSIWCPLNLASPVSPSTNRSRILTDTSSYKPNPHCIHKFPRKHMARTTASCPLKHAPIQMRTSQQTRFVKAYPIAQWSSAKSKNFEIRKEKRSRHYATKRKVEETNRQGNHHARLLSTQQPASRS